jgi:hypothetical protein
LPIGGVWVGGSVQLAGVLQVVLSSGAVEAATQDPLRLQGPLHIKSARTELGVSVVSCSGHKAARSQVLMAWPVKLQ